ncbi:MAG: hypothetical protein CVV44_07925 [Spirochaetae bacterium HGW-Spirochaetae-1]|nr:MAG: hypothetical protein CVV44_07925 [Spirochaetae bacterium HGW-Spirochaetae-1]
MRLLYCFSRNLSALINGNSNEPDRFFKWEWKNTLTFLCDAIDIFIKYKDIKAFLSGPEADTYLFLASGEKARWLR